MRQSVRPSGIRTANVSPTSGGSPTKWRTASAPMFDSVSSGGPKIRTEAPKASKPDQPAPHYGGPSTRGLKDWDEPSAPVKKDRVISTRPKGKLIHRLVRPDGTAIEARMLAIVKEKRAITDAHPDADLPKSGSLVNLPVGPHVKVINVYGIITKMTDTAPRLDNWDRTKSPITLKDGRVVAKSTSVAVKMSEKEMDKLRQPRPITCGTFYPKTW